MSKEDKDAALVKDYERPSKDCPFKVKNIEECDAKRITVIKRTEEDGPFKGKLDTLEINCWCKFPMYHFLKDLAHYSRSWKALVDSILKDD